MKIEKNMLYQILIISAIIVSILLWLVFPLMILAFPIILFIGIILLVIVRKKGYFDDERALKISEKASEKTIIVFVFGSMMLLFTSGLIIYFFPDSIGSNTLSRWMLELIGSMFQSALIISVIYLFFYVYYRYIYGGVLK